MSWFIVLCGTPILFVSGIASLLEATPTLPVRSADDAVKALAEAHNLSGQELFSRLSETPGNIVISPYSIGTAMAMALSGARGETEAEMQRVLWHRLPRTEMDAANKEAIASFGAYGRKRALSQKPVAIKLMTANALMIGKDRNRLSEEFLTQMRNHYAAEIFEHATPADINRWVSRQTEGKIDGVVDQIDPNTLSVLLNVIYFKARWMLPFDRRLTWQPFSLTATQQVAVPMMFREDIYDVASGPGFSAIRLPYEAPELHMVVVLPRGIGQRDMIAAQSAGALLADNKLHWDNRKLELAIPRFKATSTLSLKNHFVALGLRNAFKQGEADFSGMTGGTKSEDPIAIDEINHRAVVEVSQEGTEAAAATAVYVADSYSEPQIFHVNRPFLFYITDDVTGAILFQGRIMDPRVSN